MNINTKKLEKLNYELKNILRDIENMSKYGITLVIYRDDYYSHKEYRYGDYRFILGGDQNFVKLNKKIVNKEGMVKIVTCTITEEEELYGELKKLKSSLLDDIQDSIDSIDIDA